MEGSTVQIALLPLFTVLALSVAPEIKRLRAPGGGGSKRAWIAIVFSVAGIVLCLLSVPQAILIVLFLLAVGSTLAVLSEAESLEWLKALDLRVRRLSRAQVAAAVAAVAFGIAGLAVWALLSSDHSSSIADAIKTGRYEIKGTCGDGSCTINLCERPSACGLDNIGRLPEERRVSIECQRRGGEVTTDDGLHVSYIWDRVAPQVFITDLFVRGTKFNRFSPDLPRCRAV